MPPSDVALIPIPAKPVAREGAFTLSAATKIVAQSAMRPIVELFRDALHASTGLPLPIVDQTAGSRIGLSLDPRLASLGEEGYRLVVYPDLIDIRAPQLQGLSRATQTLRQLLPPQVYRRALVQNTPWQIPCLDIEDTPRFVWRGSHLDVGRHFMPKEMILKHIDLLAMHKLNVFHWHLTEDQGWRIEIKRYPRLTDVGAWRPDSMTLPLTRDASKRKFSGVPHAGFYTQDDVREVVRYAADRYITVVPEIEMPGHALALIAAYPELGNTGKQYDVKTFWGIEEHVLGVGDNVFEFLENVLDEVLGLFPSKFVHIGGDEAPKREWKDSPAAQQRIKDEGLKDEDELQSWFVRRIDAWLTSRGRRLIGWDEILEGGLAPGAAVMSWRGEKGGIAAARAGHDVVMAPEKPTYFDHDQSEDDVRIRGLNTIEDVYAYEPIPRELGEAEAKHVLGAQGQLWTEYMPTPQRVEYMAWPRLCALAEVLWSPRTTRDSAGFARRMETHLERLRILDVNYRGRWGHAKKPD
jgi:hexosaminidase